MGDVEGDNPALLNLAGPIVFRGFDPSVGLLVAGVTAYHTRGD